MQSKSVFIGALLIAACSPVMMTGQGVVVVPNNVGASYPIINQNFTWLNANKMASPAPASQVTYTAPGAGAVPSTVQTAIAALGPTVIGYGAIGDGSDNTAAFSKAITAAAGSPIVVPAGTYALNSLAVTGAAYFRLESGATIVRMAGAVQAIYLTADLTIEGGTLDGLKSSTSVWGNFITIPNFVSGMTVRITGSHIQNTLASFIQAFNFAGELDIEHCTFTGQSESGGTLAHGTAIAYIQSGETGEKGLFRFNHNTAIATVPAAGGDGYSPGGIFYCTRDDLGDLTQGNYSTLEAIGNYFYGYGQNVAGNDISPIHFYPVVGGARIIGNYFEQCAFSCMSLKSAVDLVVDGNTIQNGQTTTQNVWTEGAIGYEPGYQAGTNVRPRAVISNNVIDTPGGETGVAKQTCISVKGTGGAGSYATDVIVTGNVVAGCGAGIYADYVTNLQVTNNNVVGATGGTTGAESGIEIHHAAGDITVANNQVYTSNGPGLANSDNLVQTANFLVTGNDFENTTNASYAVDLRGENLVKFSGNTFNSTHTNAVELTTNGTFGINELAWDQSNTVVAGALSFDYSEIGAIAGVIQGTNSPVSLVTPVSVGTQYIQTNLQSIVTVQTTGVGLSDITVGGTWSGIVGPHSIAFTVGTTGTPDQFSWALDGGSATTGAPMTACPTTVAIVSGITACWTASTGHTTANVWTSTLFGSAVVWTANGTTNTTWQTPKPSCVGQDPSACVEIYLVGVPGSTNYEKTFLRYAGGVATIGTTAGGTGGPTDFSINPYTIGDIFHAYISDGHVTVGKTGASVIFPGPPITALGNRWGCTHGSNATCGSITLSGGMSATISTTAACSPASGGSGCSYILTPQTCSSCGTLYPSSVSSGTSFVISSTNGSDGSLVYWEIRGVI